MCKLSFYLLHLIYCKEGFGNPSEVNRAQPTCQPTSWSGQLVRVQSGSENTVALAYTENLSGQWSRCSLLTGTVPSGCAEQVGMPSEGGQSSFAIQIALFLLNEVHVLSQEQVEVLENDRRNLAIAQKVADVFKVYEDRLRWRLETFEHDKQRRAWRMCE